MRWLFGKKWYWVPIAFVILVGIAVVLQLFKEDNTYAEWVVTFVRDWATVLSASVAAVTLLMLLITFRSERRSSSLRSIESWARETYQFFSTNKTYSECREHIYEYIGIGLVANDMTEQIDERLKEKVTSVVINLAKLKDIWDDFITNTASAEDEVKDIEYTTTFNDTLNGLREVIKISSKM